MAEHPAKFSRPILETIQLLIYRELEDSIPVNSIFKILDPFAGAGGIHQIPRVMHKSIHAGLWQFVIATIGVEIEPEWASIYSPGQNDGGYTICGDATDLPKAWSNYFDAVITSPTFANRMADHHNAKDGSKRITYRHVLGRDLSPNNSGAMQWGNDYRVLHLKAWSEALRVLKSEGLMVLNISNHIRKGTEQPVVEWHQETLESLGFKLEMDILIPTRRMRYGKNGELRVNGEHLLVMRAPRKQENNE